MFFSFLVYFIYAPLNQHLYIIGRMMRWTHPIEPIGPNFICFSLDFSFMIGPFQVSYYIGDRSLVMVCRLYFQLGTICTS